MKPTDEKRKLLTGYLEECFHELTVTGYTDEKYCRHCGKSPYENGYSPNRTFDTDKDMMDLYRAIYKKREFNLLCNFIGQTLHCIPISTWLFCLSGEGYEDRCNLVAEWLEVKK